MDCADAAAMAAFYGALLERDVVWRGGSYVVLGRAREGEPLLIFQAVPDPTPGKARVHLDLHVDDVEAVTARAIELGASGGTDVAELGLAWRVLHDPEGNPFCLAAEGG